MATADWVILGLVVIFAVGGLRQGFVSSLLSVLGFAGGALLGIRIGPPIGTLVHGADAQAGVAFVVVVACAAVGFTALAMLGRALRARMADGPSRAIDSGLGGITSGVAVVFVAWLVAAPLAQSSYPNLAGGVRDSQILRGVDRQLPGSASKIYSSMSRLLDRSEFPQVFNGLTPTRVRNVPRPDPSLVNDPDVAKARASIVKVTGAAPSCSRRLEGSGFVFAPHRVVTNAHVVAGVSVVAIRPDGSAATVLDATVVRYDPERDVAVLDVPGLSAPPLDFAAAPAGSGADAIVAGYPGDGAFWVGAARIRGVETIKGPDIYADQTVHREVYAVRADIRNGNSGGPLLAPDGKVYGLIFAAAADRPDTGFALTYNEIKTDLSGVENVSGAVDTGACVSE
ncbi:MAG: MarP family serine protease [Mycobacteriales bacterium]